MSRSSSPTTRSTAAASAGSGSPSHSSGARSRAGPNTTTICGARRRRSSCPDRAAPARRCCTRRPSTVRSMTVHRRTGAQHGHERLDRARPQDGHAAAALARSRTEAARPDAAPGWPTPGRHGHATGARAAPRRARRRRRDRRVDGAEELGGGRRVSRRDPADDRVRCGDVGTLRVRPMLGQKSPRHPAIRSAVFSRDVHDPQAQADSVPSPTSWSRHSSKCARSDRVGPVGPVGTPATLAARAGGTITTCTGSGRPGSDPTASR